ncbi:MAG: competence/damage-inducible protein A [Bacteroidota bacterium]|jgi:nicotinamide-nucleotide amidase
MKAEIITIGDELLIGQTINTNAAWLGSELAKIGVRVSNSSCISDKELAILDALRTAQERSEIVILTGGLGPTKDDITKHTLCKYFETELVLHEASLKRVKAFFEQRKLPFLEANKQQAMVPASCLVLENLVGTANGMLFQMDNGGICVSLPGVPYEMKFLMETYVFGEIKERFELPTIIHRTILTQGVGESFLAETIRDWEDEIRNQGIELAYLPSPGSVKLRLSCYSIDAQQIVDEAVVSLKSIIGEFIYGEGNVSLVDVVVGLLISTKKSISTAESCTGGMLAQKITEVAGSSEVFEGGVIAYQNSGKEKELGVAPSIIAEYGVVSEETAMAMAKGCREKFGTDLALATTGWAGPTGGDEKHGVGTIFIALSSEKGEVSQKLSLGKNRDRNRDMATLYALMMTFKHLSR